MCSLNKWSLPEDVSDGGLAGPDVLVEQLRALHAEKADPRGCHSCGHHMRLPAARRSVQQHPGAQTQGGPVTQHAPQPPELCAKWRVRRTRLIKVDSQARKQDVERRGNGSFGAPPAECPMAGGVPVAGALMLCLPGQELGESCGQLEGFLEGFAHGLHAPHILPAGDRSTALRLANPPAGCGAEALPGLIPILLLDAEQLACTAASHRINQQRFPASHLKAARPPALSQSHGRNQCGGWKRRRCEAVTGGGVDASWD